MKTIIKNFPSNLLCFSHLRWDFVYQRPQHLLNRFNNIFNIFFLEEPMFDADEYGYLTFAERGNKVYVGVPHLPAGLNDQEVMSMMQSLVDSFLQSKNLDDFAFWYYSPMAIAFSGKHTPKLTIYDCMDELSAFKNAPRELINMERKLLKNADLVFTGGHSLYEAKKNKHANIHPFPSSIEKEHFEKARTGNHEPADQAAISGPKIGFYGVIDERLDIDLIRDIATAKPEWQLIILGPVVKVDPEILPRNANIHYLGSKSYDDLPAYLSGWDVALIPFAINESTRYISPTKTPEYLAAGKPVVSTPIKDVINPYGDNKLVHIGANANEFIKAISIELETKNKAKWIAKVDKFLMQNSWDTTYQNMFELIVSTIKNKNTISVAS